MPLIKDFSDLDAWKSSMEMTISIYVLIEDPKVLKYDYGLIDQVRRASVSVMNNIAEGFGRFSNKEFVRFLNISMASLDEVESMILLIDRLEYFTPEATQPVKENIILTRKLIAGLLRHVRAKIQNT